jgi:hypothetical protein
MMGGGKEEGAVCTPEGTPDPNATYKYDADGDCVMTCKSGYLKEDGVCVEEVKFNVPIHCIVGGTPSGMLQYGKLYAEKTGGKNAQEFSTVTQQSACSLKKMMKAFLLERVV